MARIRRHPADASARGLHMLLISVDALWADTLAPTAKDRAEFPRIFQLLDESAVFTRAFAPSAGKDLSFSGDLDWAARPVRAGRADPRRGPIRDRPRRPRGDPQRGAALRRQDPEHARARGLDDHDRLVNDLGARAVSSYSTSARTTELGLAFLDPKGGRGFEACHRARIRGSW